MGKKHKSICIPYKCPPKCVHHNIKDFNNQVDKMIIYESTSLFYQDHRLMNKVAMVAGIAQQHGLSLTKVSMPIVTVGGCPN
jgi:hypothetical protein